MVKQNLSQITEHMGREMRNLFKLSPHTIPALLPALMLLFFCSTSFAGEGINVDTDSSTQAAAEPPAQSELDAAAPAEPASSP